MVIVIRGKHKWGMDGYLKNLLDDFHHAVHKKNTSVVTITDGDSGRGKTTFSIQKGTYLSKTFGLNNIHFDPESFLENLSNAKKGDYISYDEAMPISSRSALSKTNRVMIQALSMIRSKNIFVNFNINSCFDIDKHIVLHRANCLFHLYGDSFIDRGKFTAFFKAKDDPQDRLKELYLHGKKFYSYSRPRANFYGSFPIDFLIDEKAYEKKKQEAVNEFLRTGLEPPKKCDQITANLVAYLKSQKMKVPKIADIAGVSDRTIYNLLKRANINIIK